MIDKIKLQEIYKQGATLADMKLIMEDIVSSIQFFVLVCMIGIEWDC